MMSAWPVAKLADVATIERSSIQAGDIDEASYFVGLENMVSGGGLADVGTAGESGVSSTKFRFDSRQVLFGKLRPYLAKIACPDFDGVCSTDIIPISPGPVLDRSYLRHFLASPDMIALATIRSAGANLPRLSPTELAKFPIPMPSIDIQRQIAKVLDQVESLRAKRRAAIVLLDELAQSTFLDMFGKVVPNDKGWPVGAVSDIVAKFESGKSIAEAESDGPEIKYRILRVSAVTTGRFNPSESKPAPAAYGPPDSHIVRDGDLIFSRANTEALIGATALAVDPPPNLLLPDKLWRFVWRDKNSTHPLYVRQLFLQEEFRRQVRIRASGTSGSMKNISQANVLAIPCGVPSGRLQIEYGRKVEVLDRLRVQHENHLAELDALFASLQDRAFRGTLWTEESTPVA